MHVMFVTKGFLDQAIYQCTKELILQTNLMNAMFVTRGFPQHFHDE